MLQYSRKISYDRFTVMIDEEIEPLSNEEWETINEYCYHAKLYMVPIAVSLHEPDSLLAERVCLTLSTHADWNVRGNAILGFGHLARRFGKLNFGETIRQLVEDALRDANDYVRGQANAAAGDIEFFLKWQLDKPEDSQSID